MRKHWFSPFLPLGAAFAIVLAMFAGSTAVFAQGTPDAAGIKTYPVHIHEGTCAELGDVAFPLEEATAMDVDTELTANVAGTPDMMGTPEMMTAATPMADMGPVIAQSTTQVDASLDDLTASEHAINMHASAEDIQDYIACGEISGTVENDTLTIELMELNNSGFSGQATLMDNGDGTTDVMIQLYQSGTDMSGTPVATPKP